MWLSQIGDLFSKLALLYKDELFQANLPVTFHFQKLEC